MWVGTFVDRSPLIMVKALPCKKKNSVGGLFLYLKIALRKVDLAFPSLNFTHQLLIIYRSKVVSIESLQFYLRFEFSLSVYQYPVFKGGGPSGMIGLYTYSPFLSSNSLRTSALNSASSNKSTMVIDNAFAA